MATLTTKDLEDDISNTFKLPITLIDKCREVDDDIIKDLELIETVDDENKPILDHVFLNNKDDPNEICAILMRRNMCKYYTDNKLFINDTKSLLSKMDVKSNDNEDDLK